MKKSLFLLPLCLLYIQCKAQTKITLGEIKGSKMVFVARSLKQFGNTSYVTIYGKDTKYSKGLPSPKDNALPIAPSDFKVNTDKVQPIVYQVLDKKIGLLGRNNEILMIGFVFKPNGEVVDVHFTLHSNTLITTQEIEEIEKKLRTTIKATFTGKEYLQYEALEKYAPTIKFEVN